TLMRSKKKLQFLLITEDLSENGRNQILSAFEHYPIVQRYLAADLEKHFGLKNTKVLGFAKSDLSRSIYQEMKEFRINKPLQRSSSPSHQMDEPQPHHPTDTGREEDGA